MSDDWNISRSWLAEMRRKSWWHGRAVAGVMSYWVYQHLGNLSPRALDEDDLYRAGARQRPRHHRVLREFAAGLQTTGNGTRWSFCRDLGGTRVIFIDSRAGRVLEEGERSIVDEEEWEWIVEHADGRLRPPADRDHGPLAALARLPPPRGLERARLRRRLGRAGGAAPPRSCAAPSTSTTGPPSTTPSRRCAACWKRSAPASGGRRRPRSSSSPATSTTPTWPRPPSRPGAEIESAVYQAVCSPYRNPLDLQRAAGDQGRLLAPLHRRDARPGRRGRRLRPGDALAPGRGPLLRQPGGDAPPRRPRGPR